MDGNTTVDSKMMETDMLLKRRLVIEVLVAEGERPTSIHEHLRRVSGEATVDVSAVWWWLQWIKEAETEEKHSITNYAVVALAVH